MSGTPHSPIASQARNRCSGRTQAEVLAVFVLLLILGISIFTLATAGGTAYQRAEQNRTAQGELRVALSFLQMKLRQSDVAGAVALAPNPVNGQDALVLTEVIQETTYETWLYHDEGYLREALILAGETFNNDMSFEIAKLDALSLRVNAEGSGLVIRVSTHDGRNQPLQAQTSQAIRSGGVR